jgi:hypothetical protein
MAPKKAIELKTKKRNTLIPQAQLEHFLIYF